MELYQPLFVFSIPDADKPVRAACGEGVETLMEADSIHGVNNLHAGYWILVAVTLEGVFRVLRLG